jgi:hypothetical protein
LANTENRLAILSSGVWEMDGEYKSPSGAYFKLRGYFAYVASTSTSRDDGERAVMAMYLEPMSGGTADWLGASFLCQIAGRATRCYATNGAKSLLDVNILFSDIPWRGDTVSAEITEPDDKSLSERFTSRFVPRGKFVMRPPD